MVTFNTPNNFWFQVDFGWVFGPIYDEEQKQHANLRSFQSLSNVVCITLSTVFIINWLSRQEFSLAKVFCPPILDLSPRI